MIVILEGSKKSLNKLIKKESLWIKRNGISVQDGKIEKDSKPTTAEEVSDIIKKCTSLDELKPYEDDNRQIVSRVYKAKLKELTDDAN